MHLLRTCLRKQTSWLWPWVAHSSDGVTGQDGRALRGRNLAGFRPLAAAGQAGASQPQTTDLVRDPAVNRRAWHVVRGMSAQRTRGGRYAVGVSVVGDEVEGAS